MAYDTFTDLAGYFNGAVEQVGYEAGNVVQGVAQTAGSEGVVTAALLGGGAYYVNKRRKAAKQE